jgi:transglutaminase-like putative cysteine protease
MASGRLVATEWVEHLGVAQTMVPLGTAAGLALGQSIFSPLLAGIFAALYGAFLVPWQLGITLGWMSEEVLWSDRLLVLGSRLTNAFGQFIRQEPVDDPALFLFAVTALSWALTVHAGYVLTRHGRPWHVILPPALAALLVQASDIYRPRGVWYLAAYFLFSLSLLARLTFLHLRSDWQRDDARIPPLIGLDLSYAAAGAAVVLVLMAWTVPTMADVLPPAKEIWDRATSPLEERMDKLFASLERRGGTVTVVDYYSDDFRLGRGRELSDALVASVQVPAVHEAGVRYYWRARVYDHYADGLWTTSALTATETARPSAFGLDFEELAGRRTITFTFTSPGPLVTLYAAPQPRWANKPVEVDLAENPDGTVDVAALHASPPLRAGETYLARSSVTAVSISELRDAGTDYPAWVTDRYLDLPDSITPRTEELAHSIAGDRERPYDVVAAVTRYLRNNIRYSETITGTASPDQEPLDWFLFDLQVGFCNYYASSEVVLLRALGIPARLAVGFAAGDLQPGTNTHLVYERNAHAWPEVYFPGLGWVEFEPTVSQDPIVRPLGETDSDEEDLRVPSGGEDEERLRERLAGVEDLDEGTSDEGAPSGLLSFVDRIGAGHVVILVLLGVVLVLLGRRVQRRRAIPPFPVLLERGVLRIGWRPPAVLRRWATRALLEPLDRAYLELDRALRRLGASPTPADTPAERAAALTQVLPLASEPTYRLVTEYQAARYSPHHSSLFQAQRAARSIRKLSWMAKLRRLFGRR